VRRDEVTEHRCSVYEGLVLGSKMLMLFVGINLLKTPDNAVYGVREVYRHLVRLEDHFDVVIDC
jgi:hypothetical protein